MLGPFKAAPWGIKVQNNSKMKAVVQLWHHEQQKIFFFAKAIQKLAQY
jgi:hypothetical protein